MPYNYKLNLSLLSAYYYFEGLLRCSDSIVVNEPYHVNCSWQMSQVNWYHTAINQATPLLCMYQLSSSCVHFHTKIIIQYTVHTDVELSVVRIREQYYCIISQ